MPDMRRKHSNGLHMAIEDRWETLPELEVTEPTTIEELLARVEELETLVCTVTQVTNRGNVYNAYDASSNLSSIHPELIELHTRVRKREQQQLAQMMQDIGLPNVLENVPER